MRRAILLEGADQCDEGERPRLGEHASDLAGPADVLGSVPVREAEVPVQPVPQVVAVEQEGGAAAAHVGLLHPRGQRRLARPRQAREQERRAADAEGSDAVGPAQPAAVAHHVGAGMGRGDDPDHACPGGGVGGRVDDDEAARGAVRRVVVHQQRLGAAERDTADLVQLQRRRRLVAVQPVDVEPVLQGLHSGTHGARAVLEQVGSGPRRATSARPSSTPSPRCRA